jgi:hypothetical protein
MVESKRSVKRVEEQKSRRRVEEEWEESGKRETYIWETYIWEIYLLQAGGRGNHLVLVWFNMPVTHAWDREYIHNPFSTLRPQFTLLATSHNNSCFLIFFLYHKKNRSNYPLSSLVWVIETQSSSILIYFCWDCEFYFFELNFIS